MLPSGKEPACQYSGDIREAGLIPRWGRSPGGGHCNPLQYSCLENQRSLAVYSPESQRVGQDRRAQHTRVYIFPFWPPNSILIRFPFISFYTSHMEFSIFQQVFFLSKMKGNKSILTFYETYHIKILSLQHVTLATYQVFKQLQVVCTSHFGQQRSNEMYTTGKS